MGLLDSIFGNTKNAERSTENRLSEVLPKKTKNDIFFDRLQHIFNATEKRTLGNFGVWLGYDERLIHSIPDFALNVLELVSDDDVLIATRAVLLGMLHCPKCDEKIVPEMKRCPNCQATIPQGKIFFKGLNVMQVSDETKKILGTIQATQITVDVTTEKLEPVKKEKPPAHEIIANLTNEVHVCSDCGMELIPENAKFCWNCGSKFDNPITPDGKTIVVTLPINDSVITALNKLAIEKIDAVSEFDYDLQVIVGDFCELLIENKMATAKLCKKLADMFSRLNEYDNAIRYLEEAMNINPELDLWTQIERLEKKIEKGY